MYEMTVAKSPMERIKFVVLSKMGCFTVSKGKKKKYEKHVKRDINMMECTSTTLPEVETTGPSLQSAPPSFRNRTKQVLSTSRPSSRSRAWALSAPLSLIVADEDGLSMELDDQEKLKGRGGAAKDQRFSNPLPLSLPSPKGTSTLKNKGSFKSTNSSSPIRMSGPLPLPPLSGGLRNFSYEAILAACQHFSADTCVSESLSSTVYKATFGDDTMSTKKLEATVTRLLPSQSLKEFVNEVNTIAYLQHPQLCKLLGFHARQGSDQRMLVYERLFHGSLDRLLYRRSDGAIS